MKRTESLSWAIIAGFVVAVGALTTVFGEAISPPLPTGPDVISAEVDIHGMHFVPDSIEVPAGKTVVLRVTNSDTKQHDLKIGSAYTGRINPGASVTYNFGEFTEDTRGWCTIAGHKAMGMTFDVDVVEEEPRD